MFAKHYKSSFKDTGTFFKKGSQDWYFYLIFLNIFKDSKKIFGHKIKKLDQQGSKNVIAIIFSYFKIKFMIYL